MHRFITSLACLAVLTSTRPAPAAPMPEPDPKSKELKGAEYNLRVLETRRDLEFKDAKVTDVLAKLSREHRTNFVVDWGGLEAKEIGGTNLRGILEDLRVTASLKDVRLGQGLLVLLRQSQLAVVVIGDIIYITTDAEGFAKQLRQRISAEFEKAPIERVVRELSKTHGVNVTLDPRVLQTKAAEKPVTLSVEGMTFEAVVGLAAEMAGLHSNPVGQSLYVTAKGAKRARTEFLAASLALPVPEIAPGAQHLPLLLETLSQSMSHPGAVRDPSKRVTILVDAAGFTKDSADFDLDRFIVRFNSKLVGARFDTILDLIGQQMGGVAIVRDEYIELVSYSTACELLKIPYVKGKPLPQLVHRFYSETPLAEALRQMADRYERNIVLSPEAKAKKKDFAVTARLVNVPLETAVEIVADLAELRLVRKSNVLMVTTKEQAAELNAEQEKRLKAEKKPADKEKAKDEKKKN